MASPTSCCVIHLPHIALLTYRVSNTTAHNEVGNESFRIFGLDFRAPICLKAKRNTPGVIRDAVLSCVSRTVGSGLGRFDTADFRLEMHPGTSCAAWPVSSAGERGWGTS
jgi:hypothetical protein